MKVHEIAALVGAEVRGDGNVEIGSVADMSTAGPGQIAFSDRDEIPSTSASCLIVSTKLDTSESTSPSLIVTDNPKLAFARAAAALHPPKRNSPGIHPTAVISETAVLEEDVSVGALACVGADCHIGSGTQLRDGVKIGEGVTIGSNCVLHANVSIEDGCTIGDGVVLFAGVVIGTAGFGYVRDAKGEYHQFPQIGTVVIEDRVEIGANTCIDRGALGETRIGAGTKIDNLVQVGHNVQIGKRCVIAAQTGISGSTVIEDDCVIGGQVGFGDHARVKSGAVIGSQAGVLPGKIVRPGVWWGTPIQPLEEYKRQNALVKGIARLKEDVKELKARAADKPNES